MFRVNPSFVLQTWYTHLAMLESSNPRYLAFKILFEYKCLSASLIFKLFSFLLLWKMLLHVPQKNFLMYTGTPFLFWVSV